MREIYCEPSDSSSIKSISVKINPGGSDGDEIVANSSVTVVFANGSEYFYPKVNTRNVVAVLFSESIGSAFSKRIAQNKALDYVRVRDNA